MLAIARSLQDPVDSLRGGRVPALCTGSEQRGDGGDARSPSSFFFELGYGAAQRFCGAGDAMPSFAEHPFSADGNLCRDPKPLLRLFCFFCFFFCSRQSTQRRHLRSRYGKLSPNPSASRFQDEDDDDDDDDDDEAPSLSAIARKLLDLTPPPGEEDGISADRGTGSIAAHHAPHPRAVLRPWPP
jgi:hypothetical protein